MMLKVIIVVCVLVGVSTAQRLAELRSTEISEPIPYSFSYVAPGDEGESAHQEVGDGYGRVRGSYSLSDIDGNSRIVEYEADENGFRAVVRTNEPGTANLNPADVVVESSAPEAAPAAPQPAPALRVVPQPAPALRVASARPRIQPARRLAGRASNERYVLVPVHHHH